MLHDNVMLQEARAVVPFCDNSSQLHGLHGMCLRRYAVLK
jgi:hypothetical protein